MRSVDNDKFFQKLFEPKKILNIMTDSSNMVSSTVGTDVLLDERLLDR